jgi:hypothetical protein
MAYPDELDQMIEKINVAHPYIKEIIEQIHKIDCMSNMEFDYQVERMSAKYRAILEILTQHQVINPTSNY